MPGKTPGWRVKLLILREFRAGGKTANRSRSRGTVIEDLAVSQGRRGYRARSPTRLWIPRRASPDDEHHHQHDGETVPGHCVLQMCVAQRHRELARLRQAAGWDGRFLLDIERSDRADPLAGSDRLRIAREPEIFPRIVGWREPAAVFRPAHRADDLDRAG